MIDDGLTAKAPRPDGVLAQHVLPYPAGRVGTRPGAFLAAADSIRVTLHGRGSHGSMPQAGVDPVVLAATTPAVVTVGSIHADSGPDIIPDNAVLELNVRTYDETTRTRVLEAIERVVPAECEASGAPKAPEFERTAAFPPRSTTRKPRDAWPTHSPRTSATRQAPSVCRPPART